MKKVQKELKRELRIDEQPSNPERFQEIDTFLKTVSKKFNAEPVTLEKLDKAYTDMVTKQTFEKKPKQIEGGYINL
jgi:hypothetical protein